MKRFRHYIKANSRSESPRHILCFDTETEPEMLPDGAIRHKLWFGWGVYQRANSPGDWRKPQWFRFARPRDFWRQVEGFIADKTTLYVFCHNTNFDLPVVKTFRLLRQMGWEMSRAVIDAPPTIIAMRKGLKKLVLLDTLNWWRVPLAELGKSVGAPKLPMPDREAGPDAWDEYCRADCEVIRRAVTGWIDMLAVEDLGGFANTLAAQSMRTWRHKFMTSLVLIDTNTEALDLSRAAYLGGRNEVFRQGVIKGKVHCVDINSMYPGVMHKRPFPTKLVGVTRTLTDRTFVKYRHSHATLGKVLLRTEEPIYPRIIGGRLCFPVGTFWAHLAGPELAYAWDHGHILKLESLAIYEQGELFTEFVEYFYKKRLRARAAGDELMAFFLKILLNSLYGKFGQRGRVWEEDGTTESEESRSWIEYDVSTGTIRRCRQLAGLVQVKSEAGESAESMPAIAAYVTSYARLELFRLILLAGWENVIYCDTDSLFVTDRGFAHLTTMLDPDRLGAPKHEWTSRKVHIRGLKDYSVGDKVKVKGVRRNATWLTDAELVQDGWTGLRGQLREGDLDNTYTRAIRKRLSREYTKGTIGPDGRVSPLRLIES